MPKNDTIIVDGVVEQAIREITGERQINRSERGEWFQRISFEQILKHRNPSPEEIDVGIVDGSNDGGIDGFYIAVNGSLFSEEDSIEWPRSSIELEVWIFTCKHHDRFRQSPLDSLHSSLSELLDLAVSNDQLCGQYSQEILQKRLLLEYAYRRAAHGLTSFMVNVGYISRGNSGKVGSSILARSHQIEYVISGFFRDCEARFTFYGAAEIVKLYRQKFSPALKLKYIELFSSEDSYVMLVDLQEFSRFVVGNDGNLRRELFESNVRDFMGFNSVNMDICNTLQDRNSPEFWWLNNGITILATDAAIIGKEISLKEIQIVNGLQTTETIFRHYRDFPDSTSKGSVLVKVIQSNDETVRDAIIRSTNNQTAVDAASLYATDKVQRDIEDMLRAHGMWYERRKNYYANRGKRRSDIVTPLYLGSAYIALGLKNPLKARSFKSGSLRQSRVYQLVFGHNSDLHVWVNVVAVMKLVDATLGKIVRGHKNGGSIVRTWRHVVGFLFLVRNFDSFSYSQEQVISLKTSCLDAELLWDTAKRIWEYRSKRRRFKHWSKVEIQSLCVWLSSKFDICDVDEWRPVSWPRYVRIATAEEMEVAERIHDILPKQPWKPGVHIWAASRLGCSARTCSRAIQILIEKGIRHRQVDGIVYGSDGSVIDFDSERVDKAMIESIIYDGSAQSSSH